MAGCGPKTDLAFEHGRDVERLRERGSAVKDSRCLTAVMPPQEGPRARFAGSRLGSPIARDPETNYNFALLLQGKGDKDTADRYFRLSAEHRQVLPLLAAEERTSTALS
jgi:hypothetical protein